MSKMYKQISNNQQFWGTFLDYDGNLSQGEILRGMQEPRRVL